MGIKFGNGTGMGIKSWTSRELDWEWEWTHGTGREWECCKPFPHISNLDPPYNTWCFGPLGAHNPNGTSTGSAVFAQMTTQRPYTLQWFACSPIKIAPSHVGILNSCNTWFIWPTRVRIANGNLIVSAVFARLTSVTDRTERQTYRQTTLVGAMRCNNAWLCGIRRSHTLIMAALRSRCGHYIFAPWFLYGRPM